MNMKAIRILLFILLLPCSLVAGHISVGKAREIAARFYFLNERDGTRDSVVSGYIAGTWNGLVTFYTFFFRSGGFVMVPATDASIPVIGFSFEGDYSPSTSMSPATVAWLEGYSRQLEPAIRAESSNGEALAHWESIRNQRVPVSISETGPLLTTRWGQGCYYNEFCPDDSSGHCYHALVGCVATAMAQVLRYHRYPAEGVGSHTYFHEKYGTIEADFGNTTYRWDSMPDAIDTLNSAVATLMSHAGISVNMNYGASSSGAYLQDVVEAFANFFNYNPEALYLAKDTMSDGEWKALLCDDIGKGLPVIYGGFMGPTGHAFVCDGYRAEDSLFHFNWGWNGSFDGWYAIGALFPGWSTAFNENNTAIFNLMPFTSQLSIRITDPSSHSTFTAGDSIQIIASVLKGDPEVNSIWLDGREMVRGPGPTLGFQWNTTFDDIGAHRIQAVSYFGNDSVFSFITVNVTDWIIQATHLPGPREIHYMSAVDSNIAWATARYPGFSVSCCDDFIRTVDGGATWIPGNINGIEGLVPSMIYGVSDRKAYCVMYHSWGDNTPGIFATADGGNSWVRQQPDAYSLPGSFPNCIHFFNETEGCAMGDPSEGEFEIYTTSDCGNKWLRVDGAEIPDPLGNEVGIVGWYAAVYDTIWFTTNRGRIFRSCDKGHHWQAFVVGPLSDDYVAPAFLNGSHGLVQQRSPYTGVISETFDGGETWNSVETTGKIYTWDLFAVPGSHNTWVSIGNGSDAGCSVSFDGGHSWSLLPGMNGTELFHGAWVNERNGWLGGASYLPDKNGIFRYIGRLAPAVPGPDQLQATTQGSNVFLTWDEPQPDTLGNQLLGYIIYRDGTRITSSCLLLTSYTDFGLSPGEYAYCVRAHYAVNESKPSCTNAAVTIPAGEILITPNPADQKLTITSDSPVSKIRIVDLMGKEMARIAVYATHVLLDVSRYPSGCYLLVITTADGDTPVRVIFL